MTDTEDSPDWRKVPISVEVGFTGCMDRGRLTTSFFKPLFLNIYSIDPPNDAHSSFLFTQLDQKQKQHESCIRDQEFLVYNFALQKDLISHLLNFNVYNV
jgi:hypothetical protein